ncbi:hypothetical protein ANTHELSMS3_00299 [Antarctobacter heliothermus]|uniref:Uncharacterized protein n=1 Tax=Antarctobacter heliothermus TaxID=74033 RepID=A0A222DYN0_9RHOB|nr:hypothetical protein [Antarctobacter heliothermus]ASP19023.1 hypothetical protein ANTHELSMS3_00299 [Antarctobacter heliothermus]
MPELMEGAIFWGIVTAVVVRALVNRSGTRRLPLWGAALVGIAMAWLGMPVLAGAQDLWRSTPWLPEVTGGALFIGGWVAMIAAVLFERKGAPRRVPLWVAALAGGVATFAVPPLLDAVTGSYQRASFRADVNNCTHGMLGQVQPQDVTNTCDFPITVGLCLPTEQNPDPCAQSVTLAPGEVARFDPGSAGLSSVPSNPAGLTVVACRVPHRPSRTPKVTGRGFDGVCLPAG